MKCIIGLVLLALAGTAAAQPKTAAEHEQELEQKRAEALRACLAKPPPAPPRVAQTNPFIAHRETFESLLRQATETCAPPRKWVECMDDNATGALWGAARRAEADHKALLDRALKHLGAASPRGCSYKDVDDHGPCINSGREFCIGQLKQDITQMQCAWNWWEKVVGVEYEDALAQAKANQDSQCKSVDAQQAAADQRAVDDERTKEAEQKKRDEEQQKKDEEAKKQADAKREADEKKREDDRKAAEAKRQAEIQRRKMIHDRYQEEVKVANAQNTQYAAQLGAIMGSLSGGGNEPTGPGSFRHFEVGISAGMVPLEGTESGQDVMTGTTGTFGIGLGFRFGAEYAPIHRPSFTLGGYADLDAGGLALPGGGSYTLDAGAGLFSSYGNESGVSALARAGYGFRLAGTSSDSGAGIVDSTTTGSDAYGFVKLRVGGRLCVMKEHDPRFCKAGIDATVGTDLIGDRSLPVVLGLEYWTRRFLSIGVEVGIQYPRGALATVNDDPRDDAGTLVSFYFSHSWDHFGGAPPAPVVAQAATTGKSARNATTDAGERGSDAFTGGEPATGDGGDPVEEAPQPSPKRIALADEQPAPPPVKDAPAKPERPKLAHGLHRFGVGAALPITCEWLHDTFSSTSWGGCGVGLRVAGDMPYGDVHADLLASGAGSTGVRLGLSLGSRFHQIGTTRLAIAVRASPEFAFEHYHVASAPCITTALQYCSTGAFGEAKGDLQMLSLGAVIVGSYTVPGAGPLSIEGGIGGGYDIVVDTSSDTDYDVGGNGYLFRFFLGARL